MRTNYKVNTGVRMRVFSEDQCRELVLAAEEAMWRTGTDFYDPESIEILRKAGCWVDGKRVRIPAYITERALRSCQKHVVLCNSRTGARELFLEGGNAYFGSGPCTPFTRNPYTNERHRATRQSVGWAAKILDALPNIDYAMSLGIVQDVPLLLSDRHEFEQLILNTEKPITVVCNDQYGQEDCIKMAEIVAGGEEELRRNPFICLYAEPISRRSLHRSCSETRIRRQKRFAHHLHSLHYGRWYGSCHDGRRYGTGSLRKLERSCTLPVHQRRRSLHHGRCLHHPRYGLHHLLLWRSRIKLALSRFG